MSWLFLAGLHGTEIVLDCDILYLQPLAAVHSLYTHASFMLHINHNKLLVTSVAISRFGPARNLWSMRFEAKHAFLKHSISKNFKNICSTLANRHQRYELKSHYSSAWSCIISDY